MRRSRSGFLFLALCSGALLGELFFSSTHVACADSFDWRNVNGQNWNTSIKGQFGGTCWDFAAVGSFESRYKLTRNDASFDPDLSEEQLCWETNPDLGGTGGGGGAGAMSYCCTHGVVSETECPVETNSAYWDAPGSGDPWPLASGWQNRCWKSTADLTPFVTSTTAGIKAALKLQGPLLTGILSYNDLYQTVADLEANYRKPMSGVDHAVVITGYQDDANVPSGGYWIIKNSWGTGGGDNGYWFIPYGDVENHMSTQAYSGAVYYTGPMYHTGPWDATGVDYTGTAATNTWKGTTSGTWDTTSGTSGNWSNNATGQAFTWVNQELQAVFDNTGSNRAITVSGTVIAHGLTFNSGATGYSFSGGSLTITAGGIQANESVSFSSNVYIGGPQSWNVASGKTLTVTGPLHTIISDLTFSGAGTTTISGAIDGGGLLNSQGAAPGGLIQAGSGPVYLTGTTNFSGNITAQSGAGTLYIAPPGAGSTTWNGAYFGGGTINFNCSALTLGGGASNFTGTFVFQKACSLTFVPAAGLTGTFGCVLNNSGSVTQNGAGTTVLNGKNTYTGSTTISSGVLQANIGTGIPSASFLKLDGGILQCNGTSSVSFTRALGTTGSTFQWTANGGGFSAGSAAMNVNIGSGASLTWGTTPGTNIMGTLKLSSSAAAAVTTFQNKVALNGATRTIFVDDNPNSTSDYAVMSGVISGSAGIVKTGPGQLNLTATDTYTGSTTISGGVLQANLGAGLPSSSYLVLDGGVLQNNSTSFTRRLGTTQNGSYFEWTANGGGFSPSGSALTVNIGGSGATLVWGSTPGTNIMGTLKLGSATATANVTFQNGLNLGGGTQTIEADGNYSTYLTGAIIGTGSLIKTGTSTLYVQGSSGNTYTGSTTILGGYVDLNKSSGYAIPGDLILGGSTSFMVSVTGANQISPNAKFSWIGTGGWQEVKLFGHSQTVTGLSDNTNMGVVENTWGESGYAAVTLTINNSTDCSFNGTLRDTCNGSTGALKLVKTGTGTQTLSNGNISYTGGTTISQGKLVLQDLTNTTFCALGVTNNATLELSAVHQDFSFSGVVSGSGALVKSGGATLTVNGGNSNTYSGGTTITDGKIVLANTAGNAIPGSFTIANAQTFVVVQNANQFPASAVVTFSGTGDPHFEMYGNTVTVGGLSGTGGGAIENTEGESGPSNGTLIINNSADYSYSSYIRDTAWGSGTIAIVKNGTGKQTLGGGSTFSGDVTINAGVISVDTLNSIGSNSGIGSGSNLILNGGTLQYTGGANGSFNRLINLGASGGTIDQSGNSFLWSWGVISGSGALTKVGSGQLIVQASNTYTGQTNVNAGALQIRDVNALGSTVGKTVVANGAILQIGGGLTGTLNEPIDLNGSPDNSNGALQVIDSGTNVTVAGAIKLVTNSGIGGGAYPQDFTISGPVSGSGALIKYGANRLNLTNAANSYTGGTIVNAGLLTATSTAAPGAITVNSGGAFSPGNGVGSATTGAATWNSGGKYYFEIDSATGSAGSVWDLWSINGNLTDTSAFTISAVTESSNGVLGQMLNFNNANSYQWLLASTTGTMPSNLVSLLSLDGSSFQNSLAATGHLYLSESADHKSLYLDYSPTGGSGQAGMAGAMAPVPEPGTLALLAAGLVGLVAYAWRKLK